MTIPKGQGVIISKEMFTLAWRDINHVTTAIEHDKLVELWREKYAQLLRNIDNKDKIKGRWSELYGTVEVTK
jgi:hypothetical protein